MNNNAQNSIKFGRYKFVLILSLVLLSITAIMGGSLIIYLGARLHSELQTAQERYSESVEYFNEIQSNHNLLRVYIRDELYSIPRHSPVSTRSRMDSVMGVIETSLRNHRNLADSAGLETSFGDYSLAMKEYRDKLYEVLALSERGDRDSARILFYDELYTKYQNVLLASQSVFAENKRIAAAINQSVDDEQLRYIRISGAILLASFLGSGFILVYSMRLIRSYIEGIAKSNREKEELLQLLTQRQNRIQELMVDLETTTEESRKRFAQDLHDAIGHNLTAAIFEIDSARTVLLPDQASVRNHLDNAFANAVTSLDEAKRISYELRPSLIDDLGLLEALRQLAKDFEKRTGVNVTMEFDEHIPRFDASSELSIYRIVQEAFTNIDKHAGAKNVSVQLVKRRDAVIAMSLRDDGRGFDLQHPGPKGPPHFGIRNIADRIGRMGGTAIIDSAPGRGTEINIEIPIQENKTSV